MGDVREDLAAIPSLAAQRVRGAGLPVDVEAVAAGPGGLLASGGGKVKVWRKVLAEKGRDGL